jgi:hypothetical protein
LEIPAICRDFRFEVASLPKQESMKKIFYLLLLLLPVAIQAQIKVFLKDRDTDKPIQYANVWKDNLIAVSSDSLGIFYLREIDSMAQYKISAIGYETLDSLRIAEISTILMAKGTIALEDILVKPKKVTENLKLGKSKTGDLVVVGVMGKEISQVAKYFPNTKKQAFYLNKFKFKSINEDNNNVVSIIIYSVGPDGQPWVALNTQNIVCHLKKGHHTTEVDLKNLNIPFWPEGVFVTVNYLLLEQNKHYSDTNNAWYLYEPSLDASTTEAYSDSWYNDGNNWRKVSKYSLNFELTLTD